MKKVIVFQLMSRLLLFSLILLPPLVLCSVERGLLSSRPAFGRTHANDFECGRRSQLTQILRRDEDELPVLQLRCHQNERIESDLPGDRVKKNVELVHDAERRFELFTECEKERKGREGALAAGEGLDVASLGGLVRVFLNSKRQGLIAVVEVDAACTSLLVEHQVEGLVRHFCYVLADGLPLRPALAEIIIQHVHVF